jgi:pimeloyl-ACP methyl ester carboxylesterase
MEIAAGLEYEVRGEGEPVLFIHGGFICDSDRPLMSQPALAGYKLIRYHRRGFAGSAPHVTTASMAGQAADTLALLQALNIDRAHVVGHSYGGAIALQLAVDAPLAVGSLVLSEPALFLLLPHAAAPEGAGRAGDHAAAGDHVAAVNFFMERVGGPDWRSVVDRMVPGASQQADKDAAVFAQESPALNTWQFNEAAAKQVLQPVLSLSGTASGPLASSIRQLLHSWLPQTEDVDIPGANHLLQFHSPESARLVAEGIAGFLRRHPMS